MEEPSGLRNAIGAIREELVTIRLYADNLLLALEDDDAAVPALREIQAASQRAEFAAHMLRGRIAYPACCLKCGKPLTDTNGICLACNECEYWGPYQLCWMIVRFGDEDMREPQGKAVIQP